MVISMALACYILSWNLYFPCRDIAISYGFDNVVTSSDIFVQSSGIWPFGEISQAYYKEMAQPHLTTNGSTSLSWISSSSSPRETGVLISRPSMAFLSLKAASLAPAPHSTATPPSSTMASSKTHARRLQGRGRGPLGRWQATRHAAPRCL